MNKATKKFLNVLAFIGMKIVPILLVLGFFVGVFFNLWKIQEMNPYAAAGLCTVGAGITTFIFGRLIKLW